MGRVKVEEMEELLVVEEEDEMEKVNWERR